MKHSILKKIIIVPLVLALIFSSAISVYASTVYHADAALEYARNHWNDGKGLCAEFVSDCLNAGGCPVWSAGATTLNRLLKEGGYGVEVELTVSSDGYISEANNRGKVALGDPIFYYCEKETDGCPYVHVVIYSGVDSDGNMTCYAHNSAKNNQAIYIGNCGYCPSPTKISAVYGFRMNNSTSNSPEQERNNKMRIWFSDSAMGSKINTINTDEWLYLCYKLYDEYTGDLLDTYNSEEYTAKLTIYEPDGSVAYTYPYSNDNNWIRIKRYSPGTYSGELEFTWAKGGTGKTTTSITMSAPTYSVTYNANGGSGAPGSQTKTHGTALTLSSTRPTRSGYTFLGWATSSGATSAAYQPGGSFTINANTTLYAVWAKGCEGGNHSYNYTATKAPTTSATGTLTGTCSKCSGTTTVTLPKLDTTNYTYSVTKLATCTANGTGRYTWKTTRYGSFYFDVVISKTGHSYTNKVTAPTCTTQGYTTHACSCGYSYKDTETKALGHSYSAGKCTVCNATDPGYSADTNAVQLVIESKKVNVKKDYVELTFILKNAPKLRMLGILNISFDKNVFSLDSGTWTLSGNPSQKNDYSQQGSNYVANAFYESDTDCNGAVFTLKLYILDGAPPSLNSISCVFSAQTSTGAIESVVVDGIIELTSHVRGDIDGNENVNSEDVMYLLNHMLFPDFFPLLGSSGGDEDVDFNKDGVVTANDVSCLINYILFPDFFPLY